MPHGQGHEHTQHQADLQPLCCHPRRLHMCINMSVASLAASLSETRAHSLYLLPRCCCANTMSADLMIQLASLRLPFAAAAATRGVVTTIRKLNRKLEKLNTSVARPTAPNGDVPSRPTMAAWMPQAVSHEAFTCKTEWQRHMICHEHHKPHLCPPGITVGLEALRTMQEWPTPISLRNTDMPTSAGSARQMDKAADDCPIQHTDDCPVQHTKSCKNLRRVQLAFVILRVQQVCETTGLMDWCRLR